MLRGALIPSVHQVARDIDAQHVRSEFRRGQCRGAIAASEIQDLEPFCDSESLHERLAAFAHGRGNAREVAFFPECFVWIHGGAFTMDKQIGQSVNSATSAARSRCRRETSDAVDSLDDFHPLVRSCTRTT